MLIEKLIQSNPEFRWHDHRNGRGESVVTLHVWMTRFEWEGRQKREGVQAHAREEKKPLAFILGN